MQITGEQLNIVIDKVRVLREHLKHCPHPCEPALNPDDLHWAVQDVYKLDIEILEVPFAAEHTGGTVERYRDRAKILIRSDLPVSMKRFIAVKELAHIAVDSEDDWSTSGVETIKSLLTEWELVEKNGDGHLNPERPLASELLAEIAAIEMMYPFEYRGSDLEKLQRGETSFTKIALEHDMPEFAVETALHHHETLSKVWQAVNASLAPIKNASK